MACAATVAEPMYQIEMANAAGEVPMAVDKIRFSLMSPKEMIQAAVIQCTKENLYTNESTGFQPIPSGVLDLRLGTSSKVGSIP
eukprot:SAG31_NODE_32060_length_360_cov_1.348659_1_plen_83_part_10